MARLPANVSAGKGARWVVEKRRKERRALRGAERKHTKRDKSLLKRKQRKTITALSISHISAKAKYSGKY